MEIPAPQGTLHRQLIIPQNQHVDVLVLTRLVSQMQVDGPTRPQPTKDTALL